MATPWTSRKRLSLIWNIVTCTVIVGVVLYIAMRTANPGAFLIAGIAFVILAFLVRKYRHAKRTSSVREVEERVRPDR